MRVSNSYSAALGKMKPYRLVVVVVLKQRAYLIFILFLQSIQGQRFSLVIHHPLSLSCLLAFAFSSPSYVLYIVSVFQPVSSFILLSQPFPPPSPSFILASFVFLLWRLHMAWRSLPCSRWLHSLAIQVQLHESRPNMMSLLSNGFLPTILFCLLHSLVQRCLR